MAALTALAEGLTGPTPAEQPYRARRHNWTNQLARHALMKPQAAALRHLGHTTTWAQLDGRVTALAEALSRRGVRFGDRVMILMLNRTEFVESFLAVNLLGAIAVPANFRLTPPEIGYLVTDCQARVLITEPALAPVAAGEELFIDYGLTADDGSPPRPALSARVSVKLNRVMARDAMAKGSDAPTLLFFRGSVAVAVILCLPFLC